MAIGAITIKNLAHANYKRKKTADLLDQAILRYMAGRTSVEETAIASIIRFDAHPQKFCLSPFPLTNYGMIRFESKLIIVYYLINNPDATFKELGGDFFVKRNKGD